MTIFRKILATTVLCFAAGGLSSCVVSTNLGGIVGNIGVKDACCMRGKPFSADEVCSVLRPVQPGDESMSGITAHDLQIYKLDNLYYMELYCLYLPRESGLFLLWATHTGDREQVPLFWTSKDEFLRTPVEAQMVLMNAKIVQHCLQIHVDNPPDNAEQMIPKEQFDFTRAVRCTPNPEKLDESGLERFWYNGYYMPQPPQKKSLLHYTLQPLAWPLKIIDHIPHALVLLPAGIVSGPFWLVEQGQQQNEILRDSED